MEVAKCPDTIFDSTYSEIDISVEGTIIEKKPTPLLIQDSNAYVKKCCLGMKSVNAI